MKFRFELLGETKKEQVIYLKNMLEKSPFIQQGSVEIVRKPHASNEMGGGLLNSISAILIGSQGPLTKLAEAVLKFVENMRSEVKLVNGKGEELVISAKLNQANIQQLVESFFEKSRQSETRVQKKTETKSPVKKKKTALNKSE